MPVLGRTSVLLALDSRDLGTMKVQTNISTPDVGGWLTGGGLPALIFFTIFRPDFVISGKK